MKDKIRKLLALASNLGAAPGEAETASRMAAALMTKYDIDLADLQEAELKEQFDLTQAEAMGCRPGKRNALEVPPWIGFIAWGLKLYTRTRMRTRGGTIMYLGPREDVELAQWLHNLLVEQCYAESRGQEKPTAWRNGYAGAIQQRLKGMVKDRVESDGTALVLFQGMRDSIMDEAYGPDRRGKVSKVSASAEGEAAGLKAHIPMGRPVTSSIRLK